MNSKLIGSQQTHRKSLHQIDLQETIVLRIVREREEAIQLLPTDLQVYGGLLTHHRRGTYEEDEPLRDGVQIGSRGSGTCGGWNCVSSTPLGFSEYLGIYRHQRRWRGAPWRAQPIKARRGPLARPGGLWSPQPTSLALLRPTGCLLVQKKFPKSLVTIGLCLVLIFYKVKNKQNSN